MTHSCAKYVRAEIDGATLAEAMKQIRGPAPTVRATIPHLIWTQELIIDMTQPLRDGYGVRIGVGTRFSYDGEVVEITEVLTTPAGTGRDRCGRGGSRTASPKTMERFIAQHGRRPLATRNAPRSRCSRPPTATTTAASR